MNVLFSGGVVKNKKLQRGNIYIFEDVIEQQKMLKKKHSKPADANPNDPTTEQIIKAYESVYLLKWLFPDTAIKQYREKIQEVNKGFYPKFRENFITQPGESQSYWDKFQIIDDIDDIDSEAAEYSEDEVNESEI